MSAYYDLYQSPPDENGESVCLHARILPRGTISAGKFRELVAKAVQLAVRGVDGGSGRVGLFLRIAEMRPSGYRQERNPLSVGTFSKCEPAPREQIPQPFQYDGAGTQSVAVRIPFLDGRGGTQGKIIAAFE